MSKKNNQQFEETEDDIIAAHQTKTTSQLIAFQMHCGYTDSNLVQTFHNSAFLSKHLKKHEHNHAENQKCESKLFEAMKSISNTTKIDPKTGQLDLDELDSQGFNLKSLGFKAVDLKALGIDSEDIPLISITDKKNVVGDSIDLMAKAFNLNSSIETTESSQKRVDEFARKFLAQHIKQQQEEDENATYAKVPDIGLKGDTASGDGVCQIMIGNTQDLNPNQQNYCVNPHPVDVMKWIYENQVIKNRATFTCLQFRIRYPTEPSVITKYFEDFAFWTTIHARYAPNIGIEHLKPEYIPYQVLSGQTKSFFSSDPEKQKEFKKVKSQFYSLLELVNSIPHLWFGTIQTMMFSSESSNIPIPVKTKKDSLLLSDSFFSYFPHGYFNSIFQFNFVTYAQKNGCVLSLNENEIEALKKLTITRPFSTPISLPIHLDESEEELDENGETNSKEEEDYNTVFTRRRSGGIQPKIYSSSTERINNTKSNHDTVTSLFGFVNRCFLANIMNIAIKEPSYSAILDSIVGTSNSSLGIGNVILHFEQYINPQRFEQVAMEVPHFMSIDRSVSECQVVEISFTQPILSGKCGVIFLNNNTTDDDYQMNFNMLAIQERRSIAPIEGLDKINSIKKLILSLPHFGFSLPLELSKQYTESIPILKGFPINLENADIDILVIANLMDLMYVKAKSVNHIVFGSCFGKFCCCHVLPQNPHMTSLKMTFSKIVSDNIASLKVKTVRFDPKIATNTQYINGEPLGQRFSEITICRNCFGYPLLSSKTASKIEHSNTEDAIISMNVPVTILKWISPQELRVPLTGDFSFELIFGTMMEHIVNSSRDSLGRDLPKNSDSNTQRSKGHDSKSQSDSKGQHDMKEKGEPNQIKLVWVNDEHHTISDFRNYVASFMPSLSKSYEELIAKNEGMKERTVPFLTIDVMNRITSIPICTDSIKPLMENIQIGHTGLSPSMISLNKFIQKEINKPKSFCAFEEILFGNIFARLPNDHLVAKIAQWISDYQFCGYCFAGLECIEYWEQFDLVALFLYVIFKVKHFQFSNNQIEQYAETHLNSKLRKRLNQHMFDICKYQDYWYWIQAFVVFYYGEEIASLSKEEQKKTSQYGHCSHKIPEMKDAKSNILKYGRNYCSTSLSLLIRDYVEEVMQYCENEQQREQVKEQLTKTKNPIARFYVPYFHVFPTNGKPPTDTSNHHLLSGPFNCFNSLCLKGDILTKTIFTPAEPVTMKSLSSIISTTTDKKKKSNRDLDSFLLSQGLATHTELYKDLPAGAPLATKIIKKKKK